MTSDNMTCARSRSNLFICWHGAIAGIRKRQQVAERKVLLARMMFSWNLRHLGPVDREKYKTKIWNSNSSQADGYSSRMNNLKGKIALVTGGNRGIGAAVSLE